MKYAITLFFAIICSSAFGDELYAYVGAGQTLYSYDQKSGTADAYALEFGKRIGDWGYEVSHAQSNGDKDARIAASEVSGLRYWTLSNYWYSYRVFLKAGAAHVKTTFGAYSISAVSKTGLAYSAGLETEPDVNWRFRLEYGSVDTGADRLHRVQTWTASIGYAF